MKWTKEIEFVGVYDAGYEEEYFTVVKPLLGCPPASRLIGLEDLLEGPITEGSPSGISCKRPGEPCYKDWNPYDCPFLKQGVCSPPLFRVRINVEIEEVQ